MILILVEELDELLLPLGAVVQVVVACTKLKKLPNEKARAKPKEVGVEQLSASLAACAGIAKSAPTSSKEATSKADLTERDVSLIKKKKER